MLHSPNLITATDLNERLYRLAERGWFPDLIRRLIFTSDKSVRGLQFRANESIAISGWDGSIDQANGAGYVPSGASRWELGTNLDAAAKIKSDFAKRNAPPAPPKKRGRPPKNANSATTTAASTSVATPVDNSVSVTQAATQPAPYPDSIDRAQTTLVFVVGREWPEGKLWSDDRTKDSAWKAVWVLDANDIHTWLLQNPGIHIWFSTLLGRTINGTKDVERWWEDWAYMHKPEMRPEWMVKGREEIQAELLKWYAGDEAAFSVFASNADEARAFVAACIMTLPEEEQLAILGVTIVVTDERIWDQVCFETGEVVLIYDFESPNLGRLCSTANRMGKRVITTSSKDKARPSDKVLPPIDVALLQSELESAGMPSDIAAQTASLAGESFPAFQRTVMKFPFL